MPSHYSSIGFRFESQEHFEEFTEGIVDETTVIETDEGMYLRWSSPSGAELWLQAADEMLVGAHPHYAGESSLAVRVTAQVRRDDGTPLDGAFHAWANPQPDLDGDYPFVFDAPNFLEVAAMPLPADVRVQLAAFAHELTCYPSEEEYERSQERELKFASRSFIPTGLFSDAGAPAESMALFAGHVVRAERKRNEDGGGEFVWMSVDTLGGTYDVVADPSLLEELPAPGSVIRGTFWLSGLVRNGR